MGGIIYNTGKRPVYPRVHNTCPLGVYRYSRAGSAGRHWPSDGNQRKIKRHDNNSGQGVRLDRSPRMDGRMELADLYDKQGQTYCCVSTKDGPTDKEMEPRDRHDKKHTMRNEGQDLIQLFLDSLFLVAQFCGASPSAALADTVRSNQATQTSTKKKKKKKEFLPFFPLFVLPPCVSLVS